MDNSQDQEVSYNTFEASLKRSKALEDALPLHPEKFRVLTGERPTGQLHIGHLFGSLHNRVRLQNLGVESFIILADYQVLTDRDACNSISENVYQITMDYLACGLDPENKKTYIFAHSYIPELNQLVLPFLFLVSQAELNKNPTVKEEIRSAGLTTISAGTFIYPVHQAADILFCKGNVVPVGKDQLPHLEITRTIARRFNNRFCKDKPIFPEPDALLSSFPNVLGLDGAQKMSKSRNNAVMLGATEDETAELIKKAKTDSNRIITYDPDNRPEVANLLRLCSLVSGQNPEELAAEIGDKGAGTLKKHLTDSLNAYLKPIREKRRSLENNRDYLKSVIERGIQKAREEAVKTLCEVRQVMNMAHLE